MRSKKVLDKIEYLTPDFRDGSAIYVEISSIGHSSVHRHKDAIEILYCYKGKLNIVCNHEMLELKQGELFTIYSDDVHCIYSDTDNIAISVYIDSTNVKYSRDYLEYAYIACQDYGSLPEQIKPLEEVKGIIIATAFEFVKNQNLLDEFSKQIANNLMDIMIHHFNFYNYIDMQVTPNSEIQKRLHQIVKYCQENYREKLTISKLTKLVNINENYFSQFMRKSGYHSFSSMVNYIRCFYAIEPLLTTDMSMVAISDMCGFSDDKYFYKSFRDWWHMSPTVFKEWIKEYVQTEDSIEIIEASQIYEELKSYVADYFTAAALNRKRQV